MAFDPQEPPGNGWLPQFAPEQVYEAPKEMGGGRANFPIITHIQQHGLCHEVNVCNDEAVFVVGQRFAANAYETFMNGYAGDVWSIQLTARPGYYVAPEIQMQLGWAGYGDEDGDVGPNG